MWHFFHFRLKKVAFAAGVSNVHFSSMCVLYAFCYCLISNIWNICIYMLFFYNLVCQQHMCFLLYLINNVFNRLRIDTFKFYS